VKRGCEGESRDYSQALERSESSQGRVQALNSPHDPSPRDNSERQVKDEQKMAHAIENIGRHRDHDRPRERDVQEMTKQTKQTAEKLEKTQHRKRHLENRESQREKEEMAKDTTESLKKMQDYITNLEDWEKLKEKENQEVINQLTENREEMQHHIRNLEDRKKHKDKEMTNQMSQMADKLEKMQHRNKHLEDREKHREEEKQEMMSQTKQMAEKLEHARRQNKSLEEHNRRQSEELRITSNQLRVAETQHQQTRQLLEVKVSELKGVQTFLTNEDSLSGADVIAMVCALNAEILQISAFTADLLGSTERDIIGEMVSEEGRAALERATQRIGEPLVQALTTKLFREAFDPDPLPLQIALQVVLAHSSTEIIESWIPWWPDYDNILMTIYSRIQKAGKSHSSAEK
jgi:DNA repair exonuclease SbcCD ATPase subunit